MVVPLIPPQQHHLDAEKVYIETARRLSAAQQLATLHALQQSAWALKTSLLRSEHPDLSEEEIRELVREQFAAYCPEMGRTIPIPDNRPLN